MRSSDGFGCASWGVARGDEIRESNGPMWPSAEWRLAAYNQAGNDGSPTPLQCVSPKCSPATPTSIPPRWRLPLLTRPMVRCWMYARPLLTRPSPEPQPRHPRHAATPRPLAAHHPGPPQVPRAAQRAAGRAPAQVALEARQHGRRVRHLDMQYALYAL